MEKMITDMETWFLDNHDRPFRFWVYKKMFTPYEQEHAFMDETQFDDVEATHGYLQEAIDLGGGEWLLGFRIMDDPGYIEYHKLSDIQIAYCELDERTDMDEDEEEE